MKPFDFQHIAQYTNKPAPGAQSTSSLWDDEHISKGMLEAHLTPGNDLASRRHTFIDASVQWIIEQTGIKAGARILDFGCGPGLYATRFARAGFQVTGVDFSRRSIAYAREQAAKEGLDISYLCQNYLTVDFTAEFDVVILIYCDLGVFAAAERDHMIAKAYAALKPGGYFIFDVFTPNQFSDQQETQSWSYAENGYWRPIPHIHLYSSYLYPETHARLDQHIILDEDENIEVYRCWDYFYLPEEMRGIVQKTGFSEVSYFADVAGKEYDQQSETVCIVARK